MVPRAALMVGSWLLGVSRAACSAPPAAAPRGAIIVGVRTGPNNIDPRVGSDETSERIGELVFNTLLQIGDDLRLKPKLAERLDPPDPLTCVVTLRRGVKFHDGREMTAKDVADLEQGVEDKLSD